MERETQRDTKKEGATKREEDITIDQERLIERERQRDEERQRERHTETRRGRERQVERAELLVMGKQSCRGPKRRDREIDRGGKMKNCTEGEIKPARLTQER